jgi:putative PIN family toxin of toxin-antitoxin system
MLRVVLDTNQLISAILNPHGLADTILKAAGLGSDQKYELVISKSITKEIGRVLRYPRIKKLHNWSEEKIDLFLALLEEIAFVSGETDKTSTIIIKADPDDDKFIECAAALKAKVIISGDKALTAVGEYMGIKIVTPVQFEKDFKPKTEK